MGVIDHIEDLVDGIALDGEWVEVGVVRDSEWAITDQDSDLVCPSEREMPRLNLKLNLTTLSKKRLKLQKILKQHIWKNVMLKLCYLSKLPKPHLGRALVLDLVDMGDIDTMVDMDPMVDTVDIDDTAIPDTAIPMAMDFNCFNLCPTKRINEPPDLQKKKKTTQKKKKKKKKKS